MHILTRGFSQRRSKGCKQPRDLHIRKVSFSGSSLSSASDASTITYTPRLATFYTTTGSTPIRDRSDSVSTGTTTSSGKSGDIFPSSWGSGSPQRAFHAPPRLHERPIIHNDKSNVRYEEAATFFDDDSSEDDWDEDDEDANDTDSGYEVSVREVLDAHEEELLNRQARQSSDSFLTLDLSARPSLPRSRWSESTIQTLDLDTLSRVTSTANLSTMETPLEYDEEEEEEEEQAEAVQGDEPEVFQAEEEDAQITIPDLKRTDAVQRSHSVPTKMPNFSYKRATEPQTTAPKRPPMKTMDSLEDFIKRGGWKRRGIIFHGEEITSNSCEDLETAAAAAPVTTDI